MKLSLTSFLLLQQYLLAYGLEVQYIIDQNNGKRELLTGITTSNNIYLSNIVIEIITNNLAEEFIEEEEIRLN